MRDRFSLNKAIIIFLSVLSVFTLNFQAFGKNDPTKPATVLQKKKDIANPLTALQVEDNVIKKGETLTLERCLNIALQNNPNIGLAENTTKIYQSRIGQAKAGYFPQLSVTSGYGRQNPISLDQTSNQFSGSVAVNQLLYDFGKTHTQTKVSKLNLSSSKSDVENATVKIAFNLKQSYYSALLAKINRDIFTQSINEYEKHLKQAKAFFEIGTKSKIDVTTAEVNLSNTKLSYIKANDAYKTAIANLNNAMGINEAPEYYVADTVTFKRPENLIAKNVKVTYKDNKSNGGTVLKSAIEKHSIISGLSFKKFDITLEEAIKRAFDNRPDLKSLIIKEDAANASIKLAKTNYYPTLSGVASYGYGGQQFPLDNGWSFGANVNIPVFNGFLTKNQVNEAKANLDIAKSNIEILKQNVYLQVKQAYISLTEAEKSIPIAELIVKQADENFELANGRYTVGVGSSVELNDAEISYNNAQLAYVQAFYDYNTAYIALENAMGVK